ncbi:ABC transporter substrate-binding protein [Dactylosporangium sp. NPDC005572]|uniref:ABC transporter substrate-binding protein n=1 Tax=Dactylosporangium sp. NPDC005572 TaxID=3156889 RepID=UPI0033A8431D
MRATPRLLGVAAAAVAVLSLVACGSNLSSGSNGDNRSNADGPVVLGVLVDQTAYLKTVDQGVLKGINAAVKAINDQGGVLGGRQLQVVSGDMAADPQKQVQAFQRIMGTDKPALFVNGFSSAGNAAVAPLAKSQHVPMVVASVVPQQDAEWIFSTITPVRYETGTRVEYLQHDGITKVGILYDPTPYNKQQLQVISDQLKAAGIDIAGAEQHASDAVDLRPQVSKLLGAGAQAIIKLSSGPTQIVAAKALADAGSRAPLLIGIESRANIVQASAAYPHVLVVASPLQVNAVLKEADRSQSVKSFTDTNPAEQDPTYVGRGWDAVFLAAAALEKAGSTDGQALRDALESMDSYAGTSGAYDYTASDHYGITSNPDYLAKITETSVDIVFTPKR